MQGSRGRGRTGPPWPGGSNKFTRCVLYKENLDSQAALGLLSRNLHCKPGTLAVAGTKDKRACTVQHLTAWQVRAAAAFAIAEYGRRSQVVLSTFDALQRTLARSQHEASCVQTAAHCTRTSS